MPRSVSWNDERVARLKKLAAQGLSARDIAHEFGLSRRTILGRASILKIPIGSRGFQKSKAPKPHSPRFNPVIRRAASTEKPAPSPKMEHRTAPARAPLPEPLGLTLLDLTDAICKYSTSGETANEYRFCGHPTTDGPYCEAHTKLCTNEAPRQRLRRAA